MPYASVRATRHTRIGGGPVFWLFAGTFVLMYYMVLALVMTAVFLATALAGIISALVGHKNVSRKGERHRSLTVQDARPVNGTRRH